MEYQFDFEDVSLTVDGLTVGCGFSGTAHVLDGVVDQIVLYANEGKYLRLYPQAAQNTGNALLAMSLFHALVGSLLECSAWRDARAEAASPPRLRVWEDLFGGNAEHRLGKGNLL